MQKLGFRIRQVRIAKNLTLEYVAMKSKLSTTGYGNIERGQSTNIKLSTLSKIAQVLGSSVSDLLLESPLTCYHSDKHENELSELINIIKDQHDEINFLKNLLESYHLNVNQN